jgi:hypothetical protein
MGNEWRNPITGVKSQQEMTKDQYRNAISRLGLTQAQAAAFMAISLRTSHGYCRRFSVLGLSPKGPAIAC